MSDQFLAQNVDELELHMGVSVINSKTLRGACSVFFAGATRKYLRAGVCSKLCDLAVVQDHMFKVRLQNLSPFRKDT